MVLHDVRRVARKRPALFLLGAGALGLAATRLVKRTRGATVTAGGTTGDAVTSGPTGSATSGVPGTATGDPTAGLVVEDAGAVRTGTPLPDPYPSGPAGLGTTGGPLFGTTPDGGYLSGGTDTDAAIGSADFTGTRPTRD